MENNKRGNIQCSGMSEKYFDALEEWKKFNGESPKGRTKELILSWEEIINEAYREGFKAGQKSANN